MGRAALVLTALLAFAAAARAEDAAAIPVLPADVSAAADYCANFADKANDARLAWQAGNLKKLQDEVTAKIAMLDARQAEIKTWIDKREQMLKAAGKELVDIYAKMDPEAAAAQLAQLDTGTATSVLRQLNPRGASAILNVMDPKHAAALAKAIADATMKSDPMPAKGNGT